jgi:hypothetical protein
MNPIFSPSYTARTFNKYGPVLRQREFSSIGECLEASLRPYELLKEAVDNALKLSLGFAIIPPRISLDGEPLQMDLRPLVVPWKEILEGARVFAYSRQKNVPIIIERQYGRNAHYEGLTIIGSVPSRTEGMDRHRVTLTHVPATPLRRNLARQIAKMQFYIPLTIRPSEDTEKRRYAKLRFGMPGLKKEEILPVMWTDIAFYYEYIRQNVDATRRFFQANSNAQKYWPPALEFTPFPLVTNLAVDIYRKIRNNTLNNSGLKLRDAETNLAIDALTRRFGHARVFFSQRVRDKKLEDLDWSIPG